MATAGPDVGLGILSGVQWLPHGRWGVVAGKRERFEKVDLDEVWRYLGMIQNGDGNCDQMWWNSFAYRWTGLLRY
jgi:hypothetical protein